MKTINVALNRIPLIADFAYYADIEGNVYRALRMDEKVNEETVYIIKNSLYQKLTTRTDKEHPTPSVILKCNNKSIRILVPTLIILAWRFAEQNPILLENFDYQNFGKKGTFVIKQKNPKRKDDTSVSNLMLINTKFADKCHNGEIIRMLPKGIYLKEYMRNIPSIPIIEEEEEEPEVRRVVLKKDKEFKSDSWTTEDNRFIQLKGERDETVYINVNTIAFVEESTRTPNLTLIYVLGSFKNCITVKGKIENIIDKIKYSKI